MASPEPGDLADDDEEEEEEEDGDEDGEENGEEERLWAATEAAPGFVTTLRQTIATHPPDFDVLARLAANDAAAGGTRSKVSFPFEPCGSH